MINDSINEYWGSVQARYRTSPLRRFLQWWRSELTGMIPGGLSQRLVSPRPVVWLVPEDREGSLSVWTGSESADKRDRFAASEEAGMLRERWMTLVGEFQEGRPEIRLCLPSDDVLQTRVDLPLAVEANLTQALNYQLDQVTPFRADQVYFDYEVVERDADKGRIKLDLRLVPVERIDALREHLARIGIRPHAIDTLASAEAAPPGEGFNLIPEEQRPRYVYARSRLNWLLAGGVLVALALVMALSLHLRGNTIEKLRAEVNALRAEAEEVMALQQQLEDSLLAANFLAERRRRQPVAIQVIDEVTRVLPEDIWLTQLQVRGSQLVMQGLADGSQRIIELINNSDLLGNAEFRGSVNIDPTSGRERFNAQASIITTRRAANATDAEPRE